MTSTGTHHALQHGAGRYIMHKISAIMCSSFYQALQDQERICAQLKGMVCQHQNKTTGDRGEYYPNLLFHVPVPFFYWLLTSKKYMEKRSLERMATIKEDTHLKRIWKDLKLFYKKRSLKEMNGYRNAEKDECILNNEWSTEDKCLFFWPYTTIRTALW